MNLPRSIFITSIYYNSLIQRLQENHAVAITLKESVFKIDHLMESLLVYTAHKIKNNSLFLSLRCIFQTLFINIIHHVWVYWRG